MISARGSLRPGGLRWDHRAARLAGTAPPARTRWSRSGKEEYRRDILGRILVGLFEHFDQILPRLCLPQKTDEALVF
jgi:hypothetical protein